MKTKFTPEYKAQVVLQMLREEKSVAEIASETGVHPVQLHRWRKQALERLPELFSGNQGMRDLKNRYEKELEEAYAQLGRATSENAWLKKKVGRIDP